VCPRGGGQGYRFRTIGKRDDLITGDFIKELRLSPLATSWGLFVKRPSMAASKAARPIILGRLDYVGEFPESLPGPGQDSIECWTPELGEQDLGTYVLDIGANTTIVALSIKSELAREA
jgi:hypothetical protein